MRRRSACRRSMCASTTARELSAPVRMAWARSVPDRWVRAPAEAARGATIVIAPRILACAMLALRWRIRDRSRGRPRTCSTRSPPSAWRRAPGRRRPLPPRSRPRCRSPSRGCRARPPGTPAKRPRRRPPCASAWSCSPTPTRRPTTRRRDHSGARLPTIGCATRGSAPTSPSPPTRRCRSPRWRRTRPSLRRCSPSAPIRRCVRTRWWPRAWPRPPPAAPRTSCASTSACPPTTNVSGWPTPTPGPPGRRGRGRSGRRHASSWSGRARAVVEGGMRDFDPRLVGGLECRTWVTYYRREWVPFLLAAVRLVRHAFGLNWPATLYGAWLVLRANQLWAPYPDNDPEACRRCMRRFYALVRRRHGEPFDVVEAARLEVEWWRVHRDHQRDEPG